MSYAYTELRAAYTGEASYTCDVTLSGSGSISGQTFAGKLYDPDGDEVADAVSVAILVAADRSVRVTIDGQDAAGLYTFYAYRTDDSSDAPVIRGVLELTDPSKR